MTIFAVIPTSDISATRQIGIVMKEGAIDYPAELHEAIGIKAFECRVTAVAVRR